MRLINSEDVKALINGLDSLPFEEVVDELIDRIPTAFDVDKVVEQLEDKYGCTSCDFHEEECKHDKHCFVYEMIDVVKAGGTDEKN